MELFFHQDYPKIDSLQDKLWCYARQTMSKVTRYLKDGRVRSIYQDGRTLRAELEQQEGVSLVADGPKHRFVFVLAEENSPEYAIYRAALPSWVRSFEWGEGSLG